MLKNLHYNLIIRPEPEGGFTVLVPALPGCVTFGKTFEEAEKHAREVLELWIEELKAQKLFIPSVHRCPIISEIQARIPA